MAADQMIFSSIGRDHAGTYTCTGDNGEDKVATDSVVVQVTCESKVLGDLIILDIIFQILLSLVLTTTISTRVIISVLR